MSGEVGTMEEWLRDAGDTSDRCRPFFYRRAIKDEFKSTKEGRAIYFDADYVRIEIPGESKLRLDRAVDEGDKRRWPKSWEAYQKGLEQPLNGTPIDEWAILSPGQIETFKAAGVRTIEDVANLPDSGCGLLGPNGFKMREQAKLRVAPAPTREKEMLAKMAQQEQEMNALKARLAQLEHAPQPQAPSPAPQPVRKRAA